MNSQALISFTLGIYEDEVFCDVVPMHAGDILFSQPWQCDRNVTFDGLINKYTFTLCEKKFTLIPLSRTLLPIEIREENKRIQRKREREKKKEG